MAAASQRIRRLVAAWCRPIVILFAATLIAWLPTTAALAQSQRYGGINVGSSGIKRIVVERVSGGKLYSVKDEQNEKSVNIGLVKSLNADGFDQGAMTTAGEIVKEHLRVMEKTFGVPNDRVWVVISSGLSGEARKKLNDKAPQALDVLERKIKEIGGALHVTQIKDEYEARFTFDGNVRPDTDDLARAFAIDVGSGNTKFASSSSVGSLAYGSKTLPPNPAQAAEDQLSAALAPTKFPERNEVHTLYLSGGAAYVMTVLLVPDAFAGNPKGYHELDRAKFADRVKQILDPKTTKRDQVFDEVKTNVTGNPAALAALDDAYGIFSMEQLKAGVWLLDRAIELFPQTAKVKFCGSGQTAYVRGFLEEKFKEPPSKPTSPELPRIEKLESDLKELQKEIKRLDGRIDQTMSDASKSAKAKLAQIDEKLLNLEKLTQIVSRIDAKLADQPSRADLKGFEEALSQKLQHLEQTMRTNPLQTGGLSAGQLYDQGLTALRTRQWSLAADQFTRALSLDSNNATAWYLRGVCYLHLNERDTGADSIRQAGRLVGGDLDRYFRICRAAENIQGPIRDQAEQMLFVSRTVVPSDR